MESYVLTIDNNSIKREQLNTPTIHIYKREIKEIFRYQNGALSIRTADRAECIGVPAQMEDHEKLVDTLNNILPISTKKTGIERYSLSITILVLLCMAGVFVMKDKLIVSLSGAILALVLLWSLYEGYRSKGIDSKTKKGMLYVVVVLVAVVYKVWYILVN